MPSAGKPNRRSIDLADPNRAVPNPLAVGYIVATRERLARKGPLSGAPRERCLLNDPNQVAAEYLYPDLQSAQASIAPVKKRFGWDQLTNPPLEPRRVEVVPAPSTANPPAGAIASGHEYAPPTKPSPASRAYGMVWHGSGWQGVETAMPSAPPEGSENRWCCVFLCAGTEVRISE